MRYICDAAGGRTWFRIETEAEAAAESAAMLHAVEKYFRNAREEAIRHYRPSGTAYFERDIGLKAHLEREMPVFLTLRDGEGHALVTAMLPPGGKKSANFRTIIVGPENGDPYPEHREAITSLSTHVGWALDWDSCYPYRHL